MSIFSTLKSIKETSSTNDKLRILSDNVSEDMRTFLLYALDQTKQYRLKKIPEYIKTNTSMTLSESYSVLDDLANGVLSGNNARITVSNVLSKLSDEDAELFKMILSKDINCGIQAKSINKVYGKQFLAIEPYMRCSLLSIDNVENIKSFKTLGYAVSEVKMDGQYLNHIMYNNTYIAMSRQGILHDFLGIKDKHMKLFNEKAKELYPQYFSNGVVLQGECLISDGSSGFLDRATGNGLVQKASKGTITSDIVNKIVFTVWDIIPLSAYKEGKWNIERKQRREILEHIISELNFNDILMVKYKKVHDIKEALEYNTELLENGEEGSVLKCEHNIWKAHTSKTQIKLKLNMEVDLRITGYNEGNKKRKGLLGSISAESEDSIVKVNIGGGYSDKQLKELWDIRDTLTNKIITVKCNDLIKDKYGNYSLQHPTFIEIRDNDKSTADTFERIIEIKNGTIRAFVEAYYNKG